MYALPTAAVYIAHRKFSEFGAKRVLLQVSKKRANVQFLSCSFTQPTRRAEAPLLNSTELLFASGGRADYAIWTLEARNHNLLSPCGTVCMADCLEHAAHTSTAVARADHHTAAAT